MAPDSTSLRLRPQLEHLAELVAFIEEFAERHQLSMRDLYALNLAAEELFANTIHHSNPPATFVELTLLHDGHSITVTYTDDGAPFDPTGHDTPDTTLSVEERNIGGLGVHFIRTTMEDIGYVRSSGCNVTHFRRLLPA